MEADPVKVAALEIAAKTISPYTETRFLIMRAKVIEAYLRGAPHYGDAQGAQLVPGDLASAMGGDLMSNLGPNTITGRNVPATYTT